MEFSLPRAAEALTQATLHARINGYLKQRLVDIGDHVEAGQLLAVIDAPDIDTQLNQAIAQLARSRAALTIVGLNYDREKRLLQTRVVSQQEYDQNQDIFDEATAKVKANEANLQNLMVQQGCESPDVSGRRVQSGATKVELCLFDSVSAKSESWCAFHYEQQRNHEYSSDG